MMPTSGRFDSSLLQPVRLNIKFFSSFIEKELT